MEGQTVRIAVYEASESNGGRLRLANEFSGSGSVDYSSKLFVDSEGRVWALDPDNSDRCFLYENYRKRLAVEGLERTGLWTDALTMAELPQGRFWFAVSRRLGELVSGEMMMYDVEEYPLPTSYPIVWRATVDWRETFENLHYRSIDGFHRRRSNLQAVSRRRVLEWFWRVDA